jgi:hypothetical protein
MSRRVILSRVDPASLAKVMAAFYAFVGLLVGVVLLLLSLVRDDGAGVAVAIAMIVLYPVMGFVGSWISASILNGIARRWGGIELELDDVS